ncbi:MAG TPA: glycerol-3-phosphate 1-O-acyltransferase PlsY [Anaeromyxobacteraceae bacterium]|nr:glycerol-3-phosphate 1-O-acyltransferase PlsY [Anaeromyxobacteraceae bacterium]
MGGFLAGSIPFGLLLARGLLGVDVRTVGSGNIGATNVARAGGKKLGVVVLLLDAAKGAVPMLVARAILGDAPNAEAWVVATGAAAFLGHVFTPWLRFHGGKGVATGLGVFAVLAPWAAVAGVAAFGIAYAATRISSIGSLSGTLVCVAGTFVANGARSPVSWAGVLLGAVIALRHRDNVRRLVRGEEKKV